MALIKANEVAAANAALATAQAQLTAWQVAAVNAEANYEAAVAAPASGTNTTTVHALVAAVRQAMDDLNTAQRMVEICNSRVTTAQKAVRVANALPPDPVS